MPEAAILACFFCVAVLYSSVGHAGASGYLAVMTLAVGLQENTAGPTALMLNLLVATIGTTQFALAKQIPWRQLLPFVLGSLPTAWYAGSLAIPNATYKYFVALALLAASIRLMIGLPKRERVSSPHDLVAVLVGAAIGLLAGLTRTGGGIFLTPLLLLLGWATPKQAAGLSVAFILVNSAGGLTGRLLNNPNPIDLPEQAVGWAVAAGLGGLLGSWFGARRSGLETLRRLLAVVLLIAVIKLVVPAGVLS